MPTISARWGRGAVVIPVPLELDNKMKRVPAGRLATINEHSILKHGKRRFVAAFQQ